MLVDICVIARGRGRHWQCIVCGVAHSQQSLNKSNARNARNLRNVLNLGIGRTKIWLRRERMVFDLYNSSQVSCCK